MRKICGISLTALSESQICLATLFAFICAVVLYSPQQGLLIVFHATRTFALALAKLQRVGLSRRQLQVAFRHNANWIKKTEMPSVYCVPLINRTRRISGCPFSGLKYPYLYPKTDFSLAEIDPAVEHDFYSGLLARIKKIPEYGHQGVKKLKTEKMKRCVFNPLA